MGAHHPGMVIVCLGSTCDPDVPHMAHPLASAESGFEGGRQAAIPGGSAIGGGALALFFLIVFVFLLCLFHDVHLWRPY